MRALTPIYTVLLYTLSTKLNLTLFFSPGQVCYQSTLSQTGGLAGPFQLSSPDMDPADSRAEEHLPYPEGVD